jgi:hypothetical protein
MGSRSFPVLYLGSYYAFTFLCYRRKWCLDHLMSTKSGRFWTGTSLSRRIRRSYLSFSLGLTWRNLSIHCYQWGTYLSRPLVGILFNLARSCIFQCRTVAVFPTLHIVFVIFYPIMNLWLIEYYLPIFILSIHFRQISFLKITNDIQSNNNNILCCPWYL